MPTTPRIGIPYPSENADPWYDQFEGTVSSIDASLYASREDRNIVLMDGGKFTFSVNGSTGLASLSWDAAVTVAAPVTGLVYTVSVATGLSLGDGSCVYVEVPRAPTSIVTLTAKVGAQVPSSDMALMLCLRKDSNLYFRNGKILADGESFEILSASTVPPSAGAMYKDAAHLATTGNVSIGAAPAAVDGVSLNPGDRILVWKQGAPAENGLYSVQTVGSGSNGVWVRSNDANRSDLVKAGMIVPVSGGSTNADKLFELATDNPISLGTTGLVFVIVGSQLSDTTPVTLTAVAAGSAGTSGQTSRGDHVHQLSMATLGNITTVSSAASAIGTSANLAAADHRHALALFSTDGTTSSTRGQLLFSGATVTDDSGGNRTTVTIPVRGTSGQVFRSQVPITTLQNTSLGVAQVVGNYEFNPTSYTLAGTVVTTAFKVCGFVAGTSVQGEVVLYNLTDATTVATLTLSNALPATTATVVSLPSSSKVYEIRIRVTVGTGSIFAQWVGLEVMNTIS